MCFQKSMANGIKRYIYSGARNKIEIHIWFLCDLHFPVNFQQTPWISFSCPFCLPSTFPDTNLGELLPSVTIATVKHSSLLQGRIGKGQLECGNQSGLRGQPAKMTSRARAEREGCSRGAQGRVYGSPLSQHALGVAG